MAMSASEYNRGFWDIRVNVMAAASAVVGLVLGPLLVAITGEYSLNAGVLCGLGLAGVVWLPIGWSMWRREAW